MHEIIVGKITYKFLKLVLMNENIFFTYYVNIRGYENLRKLILKNRESILLYFCVKNGCL
jgi:flagellar assembly factor FliW